MSNSNRQTLSQRRKKRNRHPHFKPCIPEGFVRDELDEDDSEDDPDFEADELDSAEDEDEEPYDAFEEPDHGFVGVRTRNSESDTHLGHILGTGTLHPSTSPFFDPFQDDGREAFEVDDLDSTDEEDEAEGSRDPTDHLHIANVEEDISMEDEDEEEEEEEEEGTQKQIDEYQQFLQALSMGEQLLPPASRSNLVDNSIQGAVEPPSWAMDDDDDFDYLRESARVHDDPLEYREDCHVSKRELVQLLSNSKGTNLRRQTRKSKPKNVTSGSRTGRVALPPLVQPHILQRAVGGAVPPISAGLHTGRANISGLPVVPAMRDPARMSAKPAASGSYVNMPPPALFQFRQQMTVHVQILTTLHANMKRKVRVAEEGDRDSERGGNAGGETAVAREVVRRSESLIRGLADSKRTSSLYHQVLMTNLSRLNPFAQKMLNKDKSTVINYEYNRVSVYNLPMLDLLEPFLNNCSTVPVSELPKTALQPFQQFNREDITRAIHTRRAERQYIGSHNRPGWYIWTVADDALLAMMIAKYGTETADFSKDLLPHRREDDCVARVRYLSSRRCPDNPVKRQVTVITAPLNKEEIEIVSHGLASFGGNVDDPELWKRIQRELLPGREYSHVQKLWLWRETRRKYKAKYRAKALQKKRAVEEGTAQA